jgi:hypothetical protein
LFLCFTFTETILETALNVSQVSHTTGTGSLSSLTLLRPVERSDLGGRVTTLSTGLLLLVERAITATTTQGVSLGVTLTEGTSTLSLFVKNAVSKSESSKC